MSAADLNPKVFELAAEILFKVAPMSGSAPGCCAAIKQAADLLGEAPYEYVYYLSDALEPKWRLSPWWYEAPVDGVRETDALRREARLLGLLLLAQLVQEGFSPPIKRE